jgi:hypothetical protein
MLTFPIVKGVTVETPPSRVPLPATMLVGIDTGASMNGFWHWPPRALAVYLCVKDPRDAHAHSGRGAVFAH